MNVPEVRPGWQGEGDVVCNALADLVVSSMTPVDKNEVEAKILLLHDILPANASFPSLISCLHPLTTPLCPAILTYPIIKALTIRFISESSRDNG